MDIRVLGPWHSLDALSAPNSGSFSKRLVVKLERYVISLLTFLITLFAFIVIYMN